MRPCSRCRRHVRMSESCCPFCAARLVEGTAPAAIGWAVGLAMLGAACGPDKPQDETASEGSSAGDDSSGGGTTSGASTTSTTGEATTLSPTTSGDGSGCGGETGCTASSEGGGFIYGSPDAGTNKECDQWAQDCPQGQKCTLASLDGDSIFESLHCVPVEPEPDQVGEACAAEDLKGHDSCDVGSFCWHLDPETNEGLCVAFCQGSPENPTCAEGFTCSIGGDGVFTPCLEACDPLAQDCSHDMLCLPGSNSFDFMCVIDQSGTEGQTFDVCQFSNGCDPGRICAAPELAEECDPMADGCCIPFCDLTKPSCTGAGAQCLPWFEDGQAPPGLEDVGFCGVPR